MPASSHPPEWIDSGTAVVTVPGEIDLANSGEVGDNLISVIDRGASTVVVDLSSTTFCDSAGINALVRAHRHAKTNGCALRLVVTSAAVRRVFGLTGVDQLLPICPTMDEALSARSGP